MVKQETILTLLSCISKYLGWEGHNACSTFWKRFSRRKVRIYMLVYYTFRMIYITVYVHTHVYVFISFEGRILSSVPDTQQVLNSLLDTSVTLLPVFLC